MRITVCAVGRLRAGPEKTLVDDYLARFGKTGRALGLGPARLIEIDERKGGSPDGEAALIEKAIPKGASLMPLDERGRIQSSPEFAQTLARIRDQGRSDLCFLIGGADGLAAHLRTHGEALSFGKMVWPHMLARVMLSEQLYRAATILAGGPYHRA